MGDVFIQLLKLILWPKIVLKILSGDTFGKKYFFFTQIREIYKNLSLFSAERSNITFKAYLKVLGLTDKEL